jgi:hypothetical protein
LLSARVARSCSTETPWRAASCVTSALTDGVFELRARQRMALAFQLGELTEDASLQLLDGGYIGADAEGS